MRTSRLVLYALLLAAASSFVACERMEKAGDLAGPVSFSPQMDRVNPNRVSRFLTRTGAATGQACANWTVNKGGGVVTIATYNLKINAPKSAVDVPTLFCAENVDAQYGGAYTMRMTAWIWQGGSWQEIHEFKVPIRVTFDLSNADVQDWTRVFVYYQNGANSDLMSSAPDRVNKTVTGILPHFTDYSPIEY